MREKRIQRCRKGVGQRVSTKRGVAEGGLSPLCSQVTNDVIGRKWLYFGITKGGGRGEMGEENERRIEKVIFSRQKIGKRSPAR